MIKDDVDFLYSEYLDIAEQFSAAQSEACRLSGMKSEKMNELVSALCELFKDNEDYECPYCHHKFKLKSETALGVSHFFMECEHCGMRGPEKGERIAALYSCVELCDKTRTD